MPAKSPELLYTYSLNPEQAARKGNTCETHYCSLQFT